MNMAKSKQTPQTPAYRKLNIVTMGGKGGTGKTTFMAALVEWFHEAKIPVVLRDLDVENQKKGGLQHYYPSAEKINVHARGGLDVFFDVGDFNESVVLADMGAGQGEAAMRWFADASKHAEKEGIGFLFVGLINNDPASVSSVLQWAHELQNKVKYWIVLNEMHEERCSFDFWHKTPAAQDFRKIFDPVITTLGSRASSLQGKIADHGLSLGRIAEGKSEIEELRMTRNKVLASIYRDQLFEQFNKVVPDFLPEV